MSKINKDGVKKIMDSLDEDFAVNSTELDRVKEERETMAIDKIQGVGQKAIDEAKGIVDSCLSFYYKEKWIAKNDYIQARTKIQKLTVSGLIKQIKLNDAMIDNLTTSILSNPNSHVRSYEVFAKLQELSIQLSRQIILEMVAMDEQMKRLKMEHEYYQKDNKKKSKSKEIIDIDIDLEDNDNEDGSIHRGARDLMKQLKAENNAE